MYTRRSFRHSLNETIKLQIVKDIKTSGHER